jgi:hypothetical protein
VLIEGRNSHIEGGALHRYRITHISEICKGARIPLKKGDSYTKVDEGYARLPGAGYEALHPELKVINPEDNPDIAKMRILADVAPYSRQYQKYSSIIHNQTRDNSELEEEYERILEHVRKTKESTLQVARRHFNAPADTIEGTVKSTGAQVVELRNGSFTSAR